MGMIMSTLTNIFVRFVILSASFNYADDIDKNRPKYTAFFMLMACFLIIDKTLAFFLQYIPFYNFIRAGFILYLRSNDFAGSLLFYNSFAQPILKSQKMSFLKIQSFVVDHIRRTYECAMERFNKTTAAKSISDSVNKIKKASAGALIEEVEDKKEIGQLKNEAVDAVKGQAKDVVKENVAELRK